MLSRHVLLGCNLHCIKRMMMS